MDDLRKFQSDAVQSMAGTVRSELVANILTLEQLTDTLADFKFRDEGGIYWTLAPQSLQWYRYGFEGWNAAVSAPAAFEGPAPLAMWAPTIREQSTTGKTEIHGKTASNPHEFMENMIEGILRSYERGEITSLTALALISDVFLMDQDNRFWTLGFRSKRWFNFEADQWHAADGPPDLETLIDTNSPEMTDHIDQAVISFLVAMAGTPPEPITDPWAPPTGYPEPIIQCPTCTRVDVGVHTHCQFCHAELPQPERVAQKATRFCTQCRHEQPGTMKFCTQCGAKF